MKKARIFDIERFSTKDGPGCRTVIFFKGCNMKCRWCHNPESIQKGRQLLYNSRFCVFCGSCETACKNGVHKISGSEHVFDKEKCVQCFECTEVCFSGALQSVGRELSVDDVLMEVMQDVLLYQQSNGGVTFSGGEMMMQADFVYDLAYICKQKGIHVCVETNLNFPWSKYEKLIPLINMVFADIKHMDNNEHQKWTGVGNRQILSNVEKLKYAGIPFVIRTPIIPGINDREVCVREIANFIADSPYLEYYELLPYNPLGKSKGILANHVFSYDETFDIPEKSKMNLLARTASEIIRTRLDGNWVE